MRSNLTFGLAAIAFGVGLATASAATLDVSRFTASTAAPAGHAVDPSLGHFSSGFAGIKSNRGSALKEDSANAFAPVPASAAYGRREGEHGLAALAPMSKNVAREALSPPPGMAKNPKGLSALKAGAGSPNASVLGAQSLAPHGGSELQRPAGANWSNGLDGLHVRR